MVPARLTFVVASLAAALFLSPSQLGYAKQTAHGNISIVRAFSSSPAASPNGFSPGPVAPVLSSSGHAIFGATNQGGAHQDGVVFKLKPSKPGHPWTEKVLLSLSGTAGDGADPVALAKHRGALYGMTRCCGPLNDGVVFKLTPPSGSKTRWSESVLHKFAYAPPASAKGSAPAGPLTFDHSGDIFGTASAGGRGDGVVFKLIRPRGSGHTWREVRIHVFKGKSDGSAPSAGVSRASNGSLYGTTNKGGRYDDGTVFRLTPPTSGRSKWTERTLYTFKGGKSGRYPGGNGVTMDKAGHLFGMTQQGGAKDNGVVYELQKGKSGRSWFERLLYTFPATCSYCTDYTSATGGLTLRKKALYGTTAGGGSQQFGSIFKLMPGKSAKKRWREETLYTFDGGIHWGGAPETGVTFAKSGAMYGTVSRLGPGGCPSACGTYGAGEVWKFVPNGR